ncbi:Allograft inflammatory factor 1-like [Galemys pyrenaicus]|uniref:Allograft inflammatory factor 1 n=1 Tax=Galemys pyrenaicus TaxID=202257 RepID=A0A8J6DIC5_GALPY|nr:Allograft inflammatory factor 1-like [Galemys pyrenaicus]
MPKGAAEPPTCKGNRQVGASSSGTALSNLQELVSQSDPFPPHSQYPPLLCGPSPPLLPAASPACSVQSGSERPGTPSRIERKGDPVLQEFLCDQKYSDEENLPEKLVAFKEKYMEFDLNNEGEIDLMSLKRMMEKLGVPKTHLEMKKMISEVTGGVSDTISYRDFVNVMLGKRSAVLKLVMMFEGKANESSPKPAGPPPERDLASLP